MESKWNIYAKIVDGLLDAQGEDLCQMVYVNGIPHIPFTASPL